MTTSTALFVLGQVQVELVRQAQAVQEGLQRAGGREVEERGNKRLGTLRQFHRAPRAGDLHRGGAVERCQMRKAAFRHPVRALGRAGGEPADALGPGQWVADNSSMSDQARDYQAQITGAPRRWAYKVCRDGECVNFDGYDPKTGTLLEGKAREYQKWFDKDLKPKKFYEGLEDMINQAVRQKRVAGGLPIRWHVAEPRMVDVLRKYFDDRGLQSMEVVYTQPL